MSLCIARSRFQKEIAQVYSYNRHVMKNGHTTWFLLRAPERLLACWVDFLVCPRRYLAVLPARARANLFAGD